MKFKLKGIEKDFTLEENKSNLIVIENAHFYRQLASEIIYQNKNEEGIIFHNKSLPENSKNILEIVPYLFNIDPNQNTLLKKIYKYLANNTKSSYPDEVEEIRSKLLSFIFKVSDDINFNLNIEDRFDLTKIFESFNLSLHIEDENTLDVIQTYMDIVNKLEKKTVFLFLGIRSLLEADELKKLYSYAWENKYNIILIERVLFYEAFTDEKLFILDSDLCEIF